MVFIYNGDELGMHDGIIPADRVVDPGAVDGPGRDPARTPMQWSAAKNAGFSVADTTWLPVNAGYKKLNAAAQADDPASFLFLYRALCHLRRTEKALAIGSIEVFETGNEALLGYYRRHGTDTLLIIINFTAEAAKYAPEVSATNILLTNQERPPQVRKGVLTLAAHEAVIIKV
jgi:alpha-glucosidase